MDIHFTYVIGWCNHGEMTIHVEKFLEHSSVSQVKKLLKLIRTSNNPECEQVIKDYITEELDRHEEKQQEERKYIIGYQSKVNFLEKQIENCTFNRDKFAKRTSGYKHYASYIKDFKEELREVNADLRIHKRQYEKNIKNKNFYEKVLEIIT